jgi:sugar (pentulose or hexulose) kinase
MIVVLDIGKSNVKLSVATADGVIVETLATPNTVHPAPPYRHHDIPGLQSWTIDGLAQLGRRHAIDAIVPCGHGSGGVLVDDAGPVMPMLDYEDEPPAELNALYRQVAGSYRERGSAIMLGASHIARQLLWLETGWPDAVARARWFLALPQFWAWWLSGVAASEATSLGAQSHLWSAADGAYSGIVAARSWQRLMPPLTPAWHSLGRLRPELARRTGLSPDTRVLCGVHDSSANFYRYQAAGLRGLTVVSTGTWIVALSDETAPDALDEARGMTCNADPSGAPLAGALCMGGREFSLIAGQQSGSGPADTSVAAAMIARGTLPVPFFGEEDGMLPGRAGRGHFAGPPPHGPDERRALATIATALLTDMLLDALGSTGVVVLDGTFVRDPLYPALVAALRPAQRIRVSLDSYGSAAGAALLAGHEQRTAPAPLALQAAPQLDMPQLDMPRLDMPRLDMPPLDMPDVAAYRARWRQLATASTPATELPR